MADPILAERGLTVRRLSPTAQWVLHCDPADAKRLQLPEAMLVAHPWQTGRRALHLSPDEWLVLGEPGSEPVIAAEVPHSLVDVSARMVGVAIEGASAVDLLASACPLDLDQMAAEACTRTLIGKVMVVLERTETGFILLHGRSFDDYVVGLIRAAALDLAGTASD